MSLTFVNGWWLLAVVVLAAALFVLNVARTMRDPNPRPVQVRFHPGTPPPPATWLDPEGDAP